jgi:NAD(P)-dependent dehydrogenase (short-subunit alcohol dehydrogenase family)
MTRGEDSQRFRPDFGLEGKVAVITGGTGVLGSVMAQGLAAAGAHVAVLGRNAERARGVVASITDAGGSAAATPADVLDQESLERVREEVLARWGRIDVLINGAGGNVKGATLSPGQTIFELQPGAMREVMDLNFFGTVLPTTVFACPMVESGSGSIVNVSSMAAVRAVTRVAGYSAAKAAIDNYTRWMAATLARDHGQGLRVNAIAPGFFLAEQNRALLMNEDGTLTPRGRSIVEQTPMARFGDPEDLLGALLWLCSDASRFVTGAVVPVDGGFSVFSGV